MGHSQDRRLEGEAPKEYVYQGTRLIKGQRQQQYDQDELLDGEHMSIVALVVLSQDTDWKEVQMVWCDDTVLEVHDDTVQDLIDLPEMSKVEEINNNQLHEMETMLADLAAEDDPETASLQHLPCRQRRQSPQKNLLPNVSDVE